MRNKTYLNDSREHLSNGRVQECILLLKENIKDEDLTNQILQLEIRHNNLKRKLITGTIDVDDSQLEENRISNALVLIISNLAKDKTAPEPKNPKKESFDFKWLVIGLLGLSLLGLGFYIWNNPGSENPTKGRTNLCENVICENGGKCINGTCKCPSGYKGDRCQTKVTPNDPCKNITCLNGGICRDGKCDCPSGYEGSKCQIKIEADDPCRNINCQNGGICRDGRCDCPSGYEGNRCQTKIQPNDPCQNINCLNGGICRDGTCDCPSGYSGSRCQDRINANEIVDTRDGKKYRIKKIGRTYWTLDNMNFQISGSKCKNCNSNGRHYDYQMAKRVCPNGWTLPSANDFLQLNRVGRNFQGIVNLAEIKFNGRYGRTSSGKDYSGVGTFAAFWTRSAQNGNGRHYFYNKKDNVNRYMSDLQGNYEMYSCRCVKKE